MARILINECKQEISSFNPVLGRYEDFAISRGSQFLDAHRGVGSETGGALSVFARHPDVEVIPGFSARAITSGGPVADADFTRIADGFLASVSEHRDADAIYFSLHGAMAAQSEHDVEGYLLEQTRNIIGPDKPIVTSLDLHGILTDRIIEHSSVIVLYHTYPHVDFFETGERSARLLLRLLAGGVNPVTVRVAIPALVRGNELRTATGRFGELVRRAIAQENAPHGLSGGLFIGNPFTDVPELCSNVVLVTDGLHESAVTEAAAIANEFWAVREYLQQPLTPLAEAIAIASRATGYTVLVDAADATSSGASGDSNAILAAMLRAGYTRSVLMPLVDPPAVGSAFTAGIGANISVPLGGALDPRFTPVELECKVRLLADGRFRNESHGSIWDGGPSALLEYRNFTFAVTSKPVSLYDRSLFHALGRQPETFDTVIVKSPHCQPHMFEQPAACYLNVDAPGSTSANLPSLGHTRCRRPIFPLDAGVSFEAEPKIYRRDR